MRKNLWSLLLLAGVFTACDSESEIPTSAYDPKVPMEVSVTADVYPEQVSKGIITGTAMPDNSNIGIRVVKSDGAKYDNTTYDNIKYTKGASNWTGSTVLLSSTAGKCYAYYPWIDGTDMSAIAMTTASRHDYMYATAVDVSNTKTSAVLKMNHAMSAVSVTLKKGTYTGTGTVTGFTWKCASAGTAGTLNALNGTITSPTGGNTAFDSGLTASVTQAIGTSKTYDFLAVPTGTAGAITFTVVMDGQTYTATSTSITMAKGTKYNYTLTMDSKTMSITSVSVTDWSGTANTELKPNF